MHKRVGFICENSVTYIEKIIDEWNMGNSVVLIDYRTPLEKQIRMLREANVSYCYLDSKLNNLKDLGSFCKIVYLHCDYAYKKVPSSIYRKFSEVNAEEEALVLFSSGTTGIEKGCVLSHRAINNNARAILGYMSLDFTDKIGIFKSVCHASTIVGEILVALIGKIDLYIGKIVYSPSYIWKKIIECDISIICLNPSLLELLDKASPNQKSALRKIYVSGSILNVNKNMFEKDFFGGVEIVNVYGLTECGPRVTANVINSNKKINSVGRAIQNVEVKIGKDSEIIVKTNSLFSKYIGNMNLPKTEWWHTGDVGYFDDEGDLYILGRIDNMINVNSHNIIPECIEKELCSIPGITDALILAYKEDGRIIFLICIYSGKCLENFVRKYCYTHFASYERPRNYIRVDKILYNHNGKKIRNLEPYFEERVIHKNDNRFNKRYK